MYVCKFCATIKGNHKKLKKFNKKKKLIMKNKINAK